MPVADPQTFDRMKAADLRSDETKYNDERVHRAVAAERERCAKCVPTNWLDPLLTGKDAPPMPLGERAVVALLRGIQDRIRGK